MNVASIVRQRAEIVGLGDLIKAPIRGFLTYDHPGA
jgi:hypothetical protein